MTNTNSKKMFAAVIAVCASSALLAEPVTAKSRDFAYSPAELVTVEGTAKVEARLRKFARQSCNSTSSLWSASQKRECREDVESQLRARIWGEPTPRAAGE